MGRTTVLWLGIVAATTTLFASVLTAEPFKTRLQPAEGVSEVPMFATSAAATTVRTVPASQLAGVFEIFELASNGMIGLIFQDERLWVDTFDVGTPDLGPEARDCIKLAGAMAPSQSSRALSQECAE